MLSSYQHYWTIIREAEEDFICILHDDDLIGYDFFYSAYKFISSNPHTTALSYNSCSFNNRKQIYSVSHIIFREREVDYNLLVNKYLSQQSVPAVSGYFYSTKLLKSLNPADYEGIYMDAAFIIHLAQRYGNVFWLPQVKFFSRVHGENESFNENVQQRGKLIRLLSLGKIIKKNDILSRYYLILSVLRKKNQDGPLILVRGLFSPKVCLDQQLIFIVLRNYVSKIVNRLYATVFLRILFKNALK